jgi:hypothetical protein
LFLPPPSLPPCFICSKWQEEREREKELELIKQHYLGLTKLKKRVVSG